MRGWYARKSAERGAPAVGTRDPEVARRSDAKRSGSPKRRASLLVSSIRQREKDPEKYKARTAVNNALRDGRITRLPCVVCGSEKSEAHHTDYAQPLVVIWFCRRHHRERHAF